MSNLNNEPVEVSYRDNDIENVVKVPASPLHPSSVYTSESVTSEPDQKGQIQIFSLKQT